MNYLKSLLRIGCFAVLVLMQGCGRQEAKVTLELFMVNPTEGETLAYGRRLADLTQDSTDPDTVARGLIVSGCTPAILHSTSWRWEKNGTLILTYIAFSEDSKCLAAETSRLSWGELFPPRSTDPLRPRPAEIREEDVLSHGIRHLTFLVRYSQDRRIAEALSPQSRQFFLRMCGQLAGRFETAREFADCSDPVINNSGKN
ncbi:MAG TPA: hypothetical protein VMG30_19325 [Acidobacteriota bacterium]|nr:hypothetical protein [Acidobacteriota bacterium]